MRTQWGTLYRAHFDTLHLELDKLHDIDRTASRLDEGLGRLG